jgi:hypothetical protein
VKQRTGGVTGRGFRPGQSGNPGGRPKGLAEEVRAQIGERDLVMAMVLILRGTPEQRRKFFGDSVKVSTKDRLEAADWLGIRGHGKPKDTLAIEDAIPVLVVDELKPEDVSHLKSERDT